VTAPPERVPAGAGAEGALALAARLANPSCDVDLASLDAGALARAAALLEAQKVSFLPIAERFGDAAGATVLAEFIARDRARYRAQRDEFERIRRAFAGERIATMVFKSVGAPPSFHYLTSNLDVVVPEGCAPKGRTLLEGLGYVELLNVEEPRKFLFRRFTGDGSSFAFHLHEVVGWGVPFLDNRALWARARSAADDPDVVIPGPSEALLVTLAHWFYEDKALSLGNLLMTAHALRSMDEALAEPAAHARRRGWEEGFWGALCIADEAWKRLFDEAMLSAEQRDERDRAPARYAEVRRRLMPLVRYGEGDVPARIPFKANKVAYYRKVMRDHARPIDRKIGDVVSTLLWAVRWKLHVRSQPALLVTLSGCDGSGKSLQAERLRAAFDACDVRVRLVWARGASSRTAGALMRAGKKALSRGENPAAARMDPPGETEAQRFEARRARLRSPFARWVFSLVFAGDLFGPFVMKTRRALLTGHVVICDRFIYDALVDYALFTGTDAARPPLALRLLRVLTPRPQVAVLLDVEPAEALRRKPEEGETAHLASARAMFLHLAASHRMTVMPAAPGAGEIQARVARSALHEFYRRYSTLINWLLRSNPGQMNPRPPRAQG
jgi:thymidylate kinase